MNDLGITLILVAALFVILGSGVWIGLTLSGVAWIGMQLFSSRPAGDAMAVTTWGSASSWTLTALPLFVWLSLMAPSPKRYWNVSTIPISATPSAILCLRTMSLLIHCHC